MDNGLEDLWRRENPDSPEFTPYDRSIYKDLLSYNLVLKRMLRYYLKTPPLTNYNNFKTEFAFFIKSTHTKKHSSANDWWENIKSVFNKNAITFSKNSTT